MAELEWMADLLKGLPEDDKVAFALFHDRLSDALERDDIEVVDYMNGVYAFLESYQVGLQLKYAPGETPSQIATWMELSQPAIERFCLSQLMARARPPKSQDTRSITFEPEQKAQIRGYLDALRELVDRSTWDEAKKDYVRKKIGELQEAVEQSRTPLERAFAIFLDLSQAVGKGAERLKPAAELLERIIGIFTDAKKPDATALPPFEGKRALPAPAEEATPANDDSDAAVA